MTAAGLLEKLRAVKISAIAVEAVKETESEYLDLQTNKQMFYGIDSTGGSISPSYVNNYYSRKKNRMNSLPGYGTPDLKVSGALYNETKFLKVDESEIQISSEVSYAKYVERRYGSEIYGLSPKNRAQYAFGPFFKAFKARLEEITGLEMR